MAITHETKGTDLGGQSGRGTDLTTGRSEVDDLLSVEFGQTKNDLITMRLQRGGRWRRNKRG